MSIALTTFEWVGRWVGGWVGGLFTWYCWYSEMRSFMLLSASVNSISSMPSPVYLFEWVGGWVVELLSK